MHWKAIYLCSRGWPLLEEPHMIESIGTYKKLINYIALNMSCFYNFYNSNLFGHQIILACLWVEVYSICNWDIGGKQRNYGNFFFLVNIFGFACTKTVLFFSCFLFLCTLAFSKFKWVSVNNKTLPSKLMLLSGDQILKIFFKD